MTNRNVASLQHRWRIIQGEVNKYVGYYSQVTKRPQSGMGVATHTAVAATLYHETEKSFAFSHCWIILNGVPKWTQLVADLKAGKKRNDGSSSHQSIGLDDEEVDIVVENGRATVSKDNRQVMGNKWQKARAFRDAAATKMSSTWMGIFSARENKKEERYKLMLDAQKEGMDWDRKRAEKKLEIEREKIDLEKQEAAIKWEVQKAKTFGEIELEKERSQHARDAEDAKIMLADKILLDEHAKKSCEEEERDQRV